MLCADAEHSLLLPYCVHGRNTCFCTHADCVYIHTGYIDACVFRCSDEGTRMEALRSAACELSVGGLLLCVLCGCGRRGGREDEAGMGTGLPVALTSQDLSRVGPANY